MTFVVFAFLIMFIVQGFKVYGSCMEPNLVTGQRLLGNKFVYRFEQPKRGDIVVFKYPLDPHRIFIKRIIGLPGETIEIHKGKVYIDNKKLSEASYVKKAVHGDFPAEKIPSGSVFVLGDNRDQSNDSRYWGDLPLANIEAKAWVRYWPLSQFGVLH
jgi:signal peptidase I